MLGFTGSIDHATHYRDFEFFYPGILVFPHRHVGAEIALDLFRHLLEESAGGASASGTCRYLRGKAANSHGLQDLLADKNFFRAVAVGRGRKRNADGIANTFL